MSNGLLQDRGVRQKMSRARSAIPLDQKERANREIHRHVLEGFNPMWKSVMLYVNKPDEVATSPIILDLLERGLRVCVPAFDPTIKSYYPSELKNFELELETGRFGILEPKSSCKRPVAISEIQVIYLPGLAFDSLGNRLGYGYGYYDRICRAQNAFKIGLAYQIQIVERLNPHARDVPVEWVITERGVIECLKS